MISVEVGVIDTACVWWPRTSMRPKGTKCIRLPCPNHVICRLPTAHCHGMPLQQVSARLLSLGVNGATYPSPPLDPVPRSRRTPTVERDSLGLERRALHSVGQGTRMLDPQESDPSPIAVVERSLEVPSWERVGSLLLDLKDFICGHGQDASNKSRVEGVDDDRIAASCSPPPTLSTPVRIVLSKDINSGPSGPEGPAFEAEGVNCAPQPTSHVDVVSDTGAEGGDCGALSSRQQPKQQVRTLPRWQPYESLTESFNTVWNTGMHRVLSEGFSDGRDLAKARFWKLSRILSYSSLSLPPAPAHLSVESYWGEMGESNRECITARSKATATTIRRTSHRGIQRWGKFRQ